MTVFPEKEFAFGGASCSMKEVHLCNNYRHLIFALADILGRSTRACIFYLEDHMPVSDALKKRLSELYNNIIIHYSTDKHFMDSFAGIPLTHLTRRNLRFSLREGLINAKGWALPVLNGHRFEIGYIYHPGFFTSKSLSCSCDCVVMRESGLNNYVAIRVPWTKSLIRLFSGMNPFRHVWGEENWIDKIEVSMAEELPRSIREKAHTLTFEMLIDRLNDEKLEKLSCTFADSRPSITDSTNTPQVLLLTQPIDQNGFCSEAEKKDIYQRIADTITGKGYKLYVKNHPNEETYFLEGGELLDVDLPIELWVTIGMPKFDLAVAICSASLIGGEALVARKVSQLMAPASFNITGFGHWHRSLPANLVQLEGSMAALEK